MNYEEAEEREKPAWYIYVKTAFIIVDITIMVCFGTLIAGGSIYIVRSGNDWSSLVPIGAHLYRQIITVICVIYFLAGIAGISVAVFGFGYICRNSKRLLMTYFCLISALDVMVFLLFAGFAYEWMFRNSIKNTYGNNLIENLPKYNQVSHSSSEEYWDNLQREHYCCGVYSFKDYKKYSSLKNTLPLSCLHKLAKVSNSSQRSSLGFSTNGCHETLTEKYEAWMKQLALILFPSSIPMIPNLFLTIILVEYCDE
ncbi:UNVERIFIED_CONTAM: hypothetical protein RMT77_009964 [Armadillidium vulgare]